MKLFSFLISLSISCYAFAEQDVSVTITEDSIQTVYFGEIARQMFVELQVQTVPTFCGTSCLGNSKSSGDLTCVESIGPETFMRFVQCINITSVSSDEE